MSCSRTTSQPRRSRAGFSAITATLSPAFSGIAIGVIGTIITGIVATAPAHADERDDPEQTLVTATRTEQTLAQALAPTTIISRADIERLQPLDLMQLLERVPGASVVRNGGYGAATSLMLRGNQGDHTLFLVDGIRIGSATLGSAGIEQINPDLIQRIEIVRGPRSSLYGSDAIGGVVNIITRRPQGKLQPSIKVGVGNHGIRQNQIFVGGGDEQLSVGITASNFYTSGINHSTHKDPNRGDEDAFRETSLGFTLAFQPTDRLRSNLHYQHNRSENEYDGTCSDRVTYAPLDCSLYSENRTEIFGANLIITPIEGWDSTLRIGRSVNYTEQAADDIDINRTTVAGEFETHRTQYSWQNDFSFIPGQILTLGYDFEREEVDSATTLFDVTQRDNDAYFVQLQSDWGLLDTTLGYRNDDNEQFGNYETVNVAAGFDLPAGLRLIASYSEGFKAPTFNDLYYPGFGDPSFIPETSENRELELRGGHFGINWSIAAFENDVENLIQYNPAIWANDQISTARITGAELSVDTEVGGWLVSLAASVIDPEDRMTGDYLRRRARQSASLDIDRSFGRWQVGMGIRGEGSRFDGTGNSIELPGYGKVGVRLGYTVSSEWQLNLKLDNLFNKEIRLAMDDNIHYYRQPGFEAVLAVSYTPQS